MNTHLPPVPAVARHPFFVYGTLMPGHPNYTACFDDILPRQITRSELPGFVLLGSKRSVYPYAVKRSDLTPEERQRASVEPVQGYILDFDAEDFSRVRRRLDNLEGVPGHYSRFEDVAGVIGLGFEARTVWVYALSADQLDLRRKHTNNRLPFIEDNNWHEHTREHMTYYGGKR